MFAKIALACACLAAVVAGLPATKHAAVKDAYTFFRGDGSVAAGWPSMNAWGSWEDLWRVNSALMDRTCNWNGWGKDNSREEIAAVGDAIQLVAKNTGVDRRFVLAIVMQESKGCVRAPTTNNGVVNPGLMQSHNGAGTCAGVASCPSSKITQMVSDGVAGTSSGHGLKQLLAKARAVIGRGANDSRAFYAAARLYNSGSVDYANLGNGFTSTACYASDVANRLTGWTLAPTACRS